MRDSHAPYTRTRPLSWLLVVIAAMALSACGSDDKGATVAKPEVIKAASVEEIDVAHVIDEGEAINRAKLLLAQAKAEGTDLSSGPCLGQIGTQWVADVAHSPRQDVDNDPANQCAGFGSNGVTRYVEIDAEGNIIVVV